MDQRARRAFRPRSLVLSVALLCVSNILVIGPASAHTAPENVFFKSYAAIDNDTFSNPRFVMSGETLSLDIIWSTCDGRDWPEGVAVEIRPLDSEGLPITNVWQGGLSFTYGFFTQADCTGGSINPVHKEMMNDDISPVSLYELRFRGINSNTVFMRAKNTLLGEPPEAPSDLELSGAGRDEVTLEWLDNSPNEESFELQRTGGGGSWTVVSTRPADSASATDTGLTPGHTYTYRVRATNAYGSSEWSNELEVTPGCDQDPDCDGLNSNDEDELGTNTHKADTDGDGLLDPWEAPSEVNGNPIENHGFTSLTLPGLGNSSVGRDQVFGPFANGGCPPTDSSTRLVPVESCLNGNSPDPLHKDIFVELDWQDCAEGNCPGDLVDADPMHHAPSMAGLALVIQEFADAGPVGNPDGVSGITLHVLVDESVPHTPNCDQGDSSARGLYFGTEIQRGTPALLLAKTAAVRYAWSGHSSRFSGASSCPNPSNGDIFGSSIGQWPLPPYDWSPFGSSTLGGRDILVTIGPVWSCSSRVPGRGAGELTDSDCDRDDLLDTGIYPAQVHDDSGNILDIPWPMARMLGVSEEQGVVQVWSRTFMHLLGHSLGLDETEVANLPGTPAVDGNDDGIVDMRLPDPYLRWTGLQYAPMESGPLIVEAMPPYGFLASQDHDLDGVAEGPDNCPGTPNADQANADFYLGDKYGDACDADADGDFLAENQIVSGNAFGARNLGGPDPSPFDTDNDGFKNGSDPDDDGDSIVDLVDNCVLTKNLLQWDLDGDGAGDECDPDVDGDGEIDLRTR